MSLRDLIFGRSARSQIMDTKTYPVSHSEAEWRKILTPEQFHIMREHGTERPGSCALNFEKRAGTFYCAGCEQTLFKSKKKFESGTGWPSFNDPEPGSIEETVDRAYGMIRTEIRCRRIIYCRWTKSAISRGSNDGDAVFCNLKRSQGLTPRVFGDREKKICATQGRKFSLVPNTCFCRR